MSRMFFQVIKDDDKAKRFFDSFSYEPYTGECFGGYASYYQGDNSLGNIYFGFIAHPKIKELADEINANFKNIKINIIGMKDIQVLDYNELEDLGEPQEYNCCMFGIELNEAYSENSNFMLKFALAEFMRGYCPYYRHFYTLVKAEKDLIDNNLKAQAISNYGAWLDCDPDCNYECARETFNKFDNIELINKVTEDLYLDEMPCIHKFIRILDGNKSIDINDEYYNREDYE